ncbi:hypothetical protein [Stomatohabitans albus]|uniref:hypothetical protein n=1 Tax=Stomatohabitans albus TaxID=3110766 RepID=UPI00300D1832
MGYEENKKLLELWRKAEISKVTLEALSELLAEEYRAYELPLRYMEPCGFNNHDELRWEFITTAFTITHPGILRRLEAEDKQYYPVESDCVDDEHHFLSQEEIDEMKEEAARDRLIDTGPIPGEEEWYEPLTDLDIIFSYIQDEYNEGKRVVIVVEEEDGYVVNFKLHGWSERLTRRLTAMIGMPERDHRTPEEFSSMMRRGDLNDPAFVYYLKCLDEFGMI